MTTKQVNKIVIGENLFHEVIEEHMPVLVQKKAETVNKFLVDIIDFIKMHCKKSDWFFMNEKSLMYNNSVVGLFPDFNSFEIGHCPLNHPYDPVTFNNEYAGYTGSLMTIQEFKNAFAGKFEVLLDICPDFFLDCYFTLVDFRKAYHSDGIRTKRWNGFSRLDSYHIPIYRINGMDSESILPAKTLYFWLENNLVPDELSDELKAAYKQILSMYQSHPECIEWKNDSACLKEDIVSNAVLGGESELISDGSDNSSFLYDAISQSITLDNLSADAYRIVKDYLLDYDKLRADIDRYDDTILTDPGRGHWALWQDENVHAKYTAALDESLIARNPVADIRYNGIIGIDFGTKSTVVVYQDKTEHVMPMRIGTGHFSKKADIKQYENPTVMELIDINRFLSLYRSKEGRPETLWEDLTISHSAVGSMMNSTSDNYYSYFNELKQWAGNKREQLRLKDKKGNDILLPAFLDIEDTDFNPIEIYAYYIGLYINNMNNGIYLDYILSFPVTFEKSVCDKIIKSFYNGIRKSFPESVLKSKEAMSHFRVSNGASEPAAYAICALEAYGFELEHEDQIYYGIFDFGGGTTDYDFGCWSNPLPEERRKYDYVLECYGGGGDQYLGGENLLELLSYEVFKYNQEKLREDSITFSLPPECQPFAGYEALITDSQESKLNTRQLMEQLRPFWENHEESKTLYQGGKIKAALFTRTGEQKLNYELNVDINELDKILHSRIEHGVKGFFECMKSTYGKKPVTGINHIHIFLAGNASRSTIVTSLFNKYMKTITNELAGSDKYNITDGFFTLHLPLGIGETPLAASDITTTGNISNINNISDITKSVSAIGDIAKEVKQNPLSVSAEDNDADLDAITKPNGKTGVAFGLIEGRPGGRIKIISSSSDNEDIKDINFRYYIGYKKKNTFAVISDTSLPYNQWTFLCDASSQDFSFYYTSHAEAAKGDMNIFDVYKKNCRLKQAYNDASIYYRAVSPTVIEYVVISSENFSSDKYLEDAVKIDLAM